MSVEQRQAGSLNFLVDKMGPQLRSAAIERLISKTEIIYPKGFNEDYRKVISAGHFPIVVSNHQSHIDGVTISLVIKNLVSLANEILPEEQKTKGFLLPLATSLATGHQDNKLKVLYDDAKPIIEKNGLFPVNLTRAKDVAKYGLSLNRKEFFMGVVMKIDQGYKGIVIFPEGTVQSGRRKKDGTLYGMQNFEEGSIKTMASIAKGKGREIVFVPVAISGGPNIFNQDRNSPNLKALHALLPGVPNGIKIRVGTPVESTDNELSEIIKDETLGNSRKLNNFFAERIAAMLPIEQRGVYAT